MMFKENNITKHCLNEKDKNFLELIRFLITKQINWPTILIFSFLIVMLFMGAATLKITGQGLYYDELHQATASFMYTGSPPPKKFAICFSGIPVMNMNYSGAIKTGLYGAYMRWCGSEFSVVSWRLVGILFVSCGLFLFCVITRQQQSLISLTVFFILFFTDINILLNTRHDWGPVALATLLRLLFISLWIRGETTEKPSYVNTFFVGVLVGFSIFEKLSSATLILPLLLMLLLGNRKLLFRHLIPCFVGCFFGSMPLIFINIFTYIKFGYIVSLYDISAAYYNKSVTDFFRMLYDYLSLSSGVLVNDFILGSYLSASRILETILITSLLLVIAIWGIRSRVKNSIGNIVIISVLSYGFIFIGIYLLPQSKWFHHWIIGTPFQYVAISLMFLSFETMKEHNDPFKEYLKKIFVILTIILIGSRIIGFISLEKSLIKKSSSIHWDPSFTLIGYFAKTHAEQATFIAADWGVATQIYCLANGQEKIVYELFWDYKGKSDLKYVAKNSGKNIIYIVFKKPPSYVNLQNTNRILEDCQKMEGWQEVPPDKEIKNLKALDIKKFIITG